MADTYTIVSQEETQQFGADGTMTDVMRVHFKATASAQAGYVTLPVAGYSAAVVDAAVRARVTVIDAVQAL